MITPGKYREEITEGIHTSSRELTLHEDHTFEFVDSDAHGGPNSSDTYRGKYYEQDGSVVLEVSSISSYSFSPVDDYPTESSEPMSAQWSVVGIDGTTIRLSCGAYDCQLKLQS